jgi:hypothetical protein
VCVHGQLGAGQSDATGQHRGRLGLVCLVACAEGSQACVMAQLQGLSWSPPCVPSYLGAQEREGKERARGGLARATGLWRRGAVLERAAAAIGG